MSWLQVWCSYQSFLIIDVIILLSHPSLGWLYVFSSFPRRPRPPPQKLFPLTSKPFELNLWYLAQSIYGSGEIYWMTFPWPWPKVTAVALISKNLLVCAIKWRTTHRITTNRGSFVVLDMVITWLDFGEMLLKIVIFANFLQIFWMCFFKVKHYFGHISGMVGSIDVKWKVSALVQYWVQYMTLTFDLTRELDLGCFKVKFVNSSISGIVGLIDVKWKGSELIWYWADCMTLPFDHTHDLDLGVSRSESEITLSQEWGGRLTMNERDVTMILTWWPWWGGRMYQIVTSDVGVPSTYLVVYVIVLFLLSKGWILGHWLTNLGSKIL